MKYSKLKFFGFLMALGLVAACSIDNNNDNSSCFSQSYSPVTQVTGPETGTVNQGVEFTVSFTVYNSCGTFGHFAESSGFPKDVVPLINYNGCECDETETTDTKTYTFTSAVAGEYELHFLTDNAGNYITKTVTITE